MSFRRFLHLLPLAVAALTSAAAELSSFDENARKEMLAQFSADEKKLTAEIGQKPAAVPLYSRRGDARMFLARFPEAANGPWGDAETKEEMTRRVADARDVVRCRG